MADRRSPSGPLVSAAGAAILAVSVFLPWYALTLTANGAAAAQNGLNGLAQQYGNAAFQLQARTVGSGFNALAGHQLATLSAHQEFKVMNVVLLVLAAAALAAALAHLAGVSEPAMGTEGQISLLGLIAGLCVLFRILAPPSPQEGLLSLSLSWGIWLALASSAAIVAGGLWNRLAGGSSTAPNTVTAWDELSGWTPGA